VNERSTRRFSQAISEGDGISVVAEVASSADAEEASRAGADALLVRADVAGIRDASDLPLLSFGAGEADAYVLHFAAHDGEELAHHYRRIIESGNECVVEVTDDEEVEAVLELLDPEIFMLSSREEDERFDSVLDLLPEVPAGKLVIANLGATSGSEVAGLERVGVDAVIVSARDVAAVVGDEPPDV